MASAGGGSGIRSCAPRKIRLRKNGFPRSALDASTLRVMRLMEANGSRLSPAVSVTSSATKPLSGERVRRLNRISNPTRLNSFATSCRHLRVNPLVCPYHPAHRRKPVRAMRTKVRIRRVMCSETCMKGTERTMRNFRVGLVFRTGCWCFDARVTSN